MGNSQGSSLYPCSQASWHLPHVAGPPPQWQAPTGWVFILGTSCLLQGKPYRFCLRSSKSPGSRAHVPGHLGIRPHSAPPGAAPSGGERAGQRSLPRQCGLQSEGDAGQRRGERGTLQAPGPCAPFSPCCPGLPSALCPLQASVCDKASGWLVGPWRREGCLQAERALPGSPLAISQGALCRELRARRNPNLAICWKQRSNICLSRPSALETKYFLLGSGLEPQRADMQT